MILAKKTAKMLCARAAIASEKIPVEATEVLELFKDPNVSEEEKVAAKRAIDLHIEKLEAKVGTTRTTRPEKKP
jgi:hypothetical protein